MSDFLSFVAGAVFVALAYYVVQLKLRGSRGPSLATEISRFLGEDLKELPIVTRSLLGFDGK